LCKGSDNAAYICSASTCGAVFCNQCVEAKLSADSDMLKQVREDKANFICFICKSQCSCKDCAKGQATTSKPNIITLPSSLIKNENNMVKIDDFLIYENENDDEESEDEVPEVSNNPTTHINKKIDQQKINNIVTNVEQFSYKTNFNKNLLRQCCCCTKEDLMVTELLRFKTIEEFLVYFKFIFLSRENTYKTNEMIFESNRESLNKIGRNLQRFLKQNLKTVKYLCKNCLFSKLNEEGGINKLCNNFDFGSIMSQQQVENKPPLFSANKTNLNQQQDNIATLISGLQQNPKKEEIVNQLNNEEKENMDHISNIENTINMLLHNNNNNNPAMLQKLIDGLNTSIPGNMNSLNNLSSNFGKLAETMTNFNMRTANQNNQVVNSVGNLLGLLNNPPVGENKENDTYKDMTSDKKDGENKDGKLIVNYLDMMNVTNIIMNFDQNKNPIISYVVNVLEDLKKQIVSIQYYSVLQKLFISHIFKNLENFNEQVNVNSNVVGNDKQEQNRKLEGDLKQIEMLKNMGKQNLGVATQNMLSQNPINVPTGNQNKPQQQTVNPSNSNPLGMNPLLQGMAGNNQMLDQMLKMKMNPNMMMNNQGNGGSSQLGGMNPLLMGMSNPLSQLMGGNMANFNPSQVMQSLGSMQSGMNPLQNPLINPQLLQLLSQNGINSQMLQGGENRMGGGNPLSSLLQGRDPSSLLNMMNK
jgi:hypothetical protein